MKTYKALHPYILVAANAGEYLEDYTQYLKLVYDGYELVKTSKRIGYISRKTKGYLVPYKGKYGTGYMVIMPSYTSNKYCKVEYWVK